MLNLQQIVVQQVIEWLHANQVCWFATISHTYGSSPRPVGSIMACNDQGHIVGSLSGGCVEETLLQRVIDSGNAPETPQFLHYRENPEEGLGALPCGGELQVLLEPLSPAHLPHFETLLHALSQRHAIQRRVTLASGEMDLSYNKHPLLALSPTHLRHTFFPLFQILLVGLTPVSLYVAEMAHSLEFRVTVCDPREKHHVHWQAQAHPFITFTDKFPDDVIRAQFNDRYSAIIALAHDPRIDDMALMEALLSKAFYVGAMGSERSAHHRRSRLLELGLNETHIASLHAPIGLPIGSKTPMEIAVSIVAQLILMRNKSLAQQRSLPVES